MFPTRSAGDWTGRPAGLVPEEIAVECLNCRGSLQPGTASYVVNRKGYHLILDDIPAYVCSQCGQALFMEEAVRVIQEMVRALDSRHERLNAISVA